MEENEPQKFLVVELNVLELDGGQAAWYLEALAEKLRTEGLPEQRSLGVISARTGHAIGTAVIRTKGIPL